jgi:ATP-dependent DNA helicase RecQ
MDNLQFAKETLDKYFGFNSFLEGQADVIQAVTDGHDCLVVMPTGGGKSLCFQLPALMRDGTTLVISPLIALMKDQVDSLKARGIRATFINIYIYFYYQNIIIK